MGYESTRKAGVFNWSQSPTSKEGGRRKGREQDLLLLEVEARRIKSNKTGRANNTNPAPNLNKKKIYIKK